MFDIKEQLKKLPDKPGVYLMKDSKGNIIYVGKSKALKKRVSSYFQNIEAHMNKTRSLVANIKEFEYIITNTEMEALILEANLIKKHKPHFNVRLKDDKSYPYIKVTVQENFPRVFKTRKVFKDKAKYFGPYTSVDAVNKTLDIIHKRYPIRTCKKDLSKGKHRPCLNYHIKQCLGPCKGDVHVDTYRDMINEIIQFLNGKIDGLLKDLEKEMKEHAVHYEYEKAAEKRNAMIALKSLAEKQTVVTDSDVDQDVIAVAKNNELTCVMIFFVRAGKVLGREHYLLEDASELENGEILSIFIEQFYSGTAYIPKVILTDDIVNDEPLMASWLTHLRGSKVAVTSPQRGEKRKLSKMVQINAQEYLDKFEDKIRTDQKQRTQNLITIRDLLELPDQPKRIEAYDISNLDGVFSVGSMVVFENGLKKNSDYRRFRVKTIEGPNDYGSMQEILFRRFRRGLEERTKEVRLREGKFSRFPDLLLIDGGKGHVNAVLDVLKSLKIDIPVAGMVKDDRHKTDRLYYNETYYELGRRETYRFIATIQDEVHRFAIQYHRSLRDNQMTLSILDDIKGIGKKRRTELLKHFKSIDKIRNAETTELMEVTNINKQAAEAIYNFFRQKQSGNMSNQ